MCYVACMTPKLQRQDESMNPYEMLGYLNDLFYSESSSEKYEVMRDTLGIGCLQEDRFHLIFLR